MPKKNNTVQIKTSRKKKIVDEHIIPLQEKKLIAKPKNWLALLILISGISFLTGTVLLANYALKSENISVSINPIVTTEVKEPELVLKPILSENVTPPTFSAKGIYSIDLATGQELFQKDQDKPLLPASTTKIATALVALQNYKPEDVVTVAKTKYVDGQVMGLKKGEKITIENLLYGLLVFSANDAAEELAGYYPEGREVFIEEMNKLAEDQGLVKTHFTNPVGFDEYLHFSTPRDMSKLATYALNKEMFGKIVSTQSYNAQSIDGKTIHKLINTNQLLGKVEGVIGVKTGHTTTSGESLITLVDRNGHKVLITMLGSSDRFGESKALIEWIYSNYSWTE